MESVSGTPFTFPGVNFLVNFVFSNFKQVKREQDRAQNNDTCLDQKGESITSVLQHFDRNS